MINNYDLAFNIIDTVFQIIFVVFAGMALSTWKKEIRGKDKYEQAKDILQYVKKIAFQVHTTDGSYHQIFLNDILVNGNKFYSEQLVYIKNKKVFFDETILGLFNHIETRSDMFLPKKVRLALEVLQPSVTTKVSSKLNEFTYIHLQGVEVPINYDTNGSKIDNAIYQFNFIKDMTYEEYFKKWEELVIELNRFV